VHVVLVIPGRGVISGHAITATTDVGAIVVTPST